jgi:hypothetical protein
VVNELDIRVIMGRKEVKIGGKRVKKDTKKHVRVDYQ